MVFNKKATKEVLDRFVTPGTQRRTASELVKGGEVQQAVLNKFVGQR